MITRDDLHIINQHSTISTGDLSQLYKNEVYPDKQTWQKYLNTILLGLGTGFLLIGIIFFFAYNWQGLHKFVKLAIVAALLISTVFIGYKMRHHRLISHLLLLGAAVLVGIWFAVYGQIYQTGANAYDFFLGWFIGTLLWVIVSNFPPIWLLSIVLCNTAINFYFVQVRSDLTPASYYLIFMSINVLICIVLWTISRRYLTFDFPLWVQNLLFLGTACLATWGFSISMYNEIDILFVGLTCLIIVWYALAGYYAHRSHQLSFLTVIALSIIIMISALMVKISTDAGMILLISVFVIISVTACIKLLLHFQQSWNHEQQ
jgi:uncharacterized membrane protein